VDAGLVEGTETAGFDSNTTGVMRPASVAETHVSVVVFIGDRAYKLKKPVETAFLDYSTRSARETICHREVDLNRRLAPDVYFGVLDILDPRGEPCDHAVAMRRMPEERRLSTLACEGRATAEMVTAVARTMAAFHARADRGPQIDAAATPAALRRLWVDNFNEMTGFTRWLLPPGTLGVVEAMALTYLDGREALFEERIHSGRIVDGQGDLLAADIFWLDDGPRILDCLEFDDRLRFGDVVLDVAFLAMDLERLGRPQLARLFLDAYRDLSGEIHPRSLEHHYIAYRALVRAKIACLLAEGANPTAAPDASALLDLCARHLYHGRVRLVLVGGPPGTGKSTLAERLGQQLGCTVLRSDQVRKELAGLAATERAADALDEGIYTPAATDATYAELLRRARVATCRGESVVLDATWSSTAQRASAQSLARRAHVELTELSCQCPPDLAAGRLTKRSAQGADASDATVEVAERIRARFDPWPTAHIVDTAARPDMSMRAALRWLGVPPLLPDS
jgi:aminoglycoside phosphotransferase family enzyme/predicted kinase